MPPEPEPDRRLTEFERVCAERYLRLTGLGIPPDDALQLMLIPDIAAEAEALHAKGCPPQLIVSLLTP